MAALPDASSPELILAEPTRDEKVVTWTAVHAAFGAGFEVQTFINLFTKGEQTAIARDGGLSPRILTTRTSGDAPRPVLSSCATLRKRALYYDPTTGSVKDVFAHSLVEVFTLPENRSRGYGGRITQMVAESLAQQHAADAASAQFSMLHSSIGREYYARYGWHPKDNEQLEIDTPAALALPTSSYVSDVTDEMVPALAARDEELLRAELAQKQGSSDRIRVALVPDVPTFDWHFKREDTMQMHVVGKTPTVRGAIYENPEKPGARVWAIWARSRFSAEKDNGDFRFLRLVVEDKNKLSEDELVNALKGIFAVAGREAKAWGCCVVEMWNPSLEIRGLIEKRMPELGAKIVVREKTEIASLLWLGEGADGRDVDWVANEWYGWC